MRGRSISSEVLPVQGQEVSQQLQRDLLPPVPRRVNLIALRMRLFTHFFVHVTDNQNLQVTSERNFLA
jgi:hypothetical protein